MFNSKDKIGVAPKALPSRVEFTRGAQYRADHDGNVTVTFSHGCYLVMRHPQHSAGSWVVGCRTRKVLRVLITLAKRGASGLELNHYRDNNR